MRTKKILVQITGWALTIWLLAGCGSAPAAPTITPAPTLPPAATAAVTIKPGYITGRVHLVSPPTPHMTVYAVDQTNGLWAFTETAATDGEASFNLVVQPGSYQVFAFSDLDGYAAYTLDELTLAFVSVAENQTASDIIVRPPSQSECGSMFGVPASPDGRFAAVSGPSADCIAAALAPTVSPIPPQPDPDAARIQFQPNATGWSTLGDLVPHGNSRFVLNAQKGQRMTVDLTTEPASNDTLYATLYIWAADGTVFTPDATTSWSGVLPASQDYYIGVASMYQQSVNYTLRVSIPAAPQTSNPSPAVGGSYGPVSLTVCQILQESASQSLATTFTLEETTPFTDPISGETGQGCTLTATGTGVDFSSPGEVTDKLVGGFPGWTEQTAYQADGPTGSATAMTRDMGLLLIHADWAPAPEVQCPADQPISACDLQPEQKRYTIQIQAAQK